MAGGMTLNTLLTTIGTILDNVLDWIPDVFTAATESPVVVLFLSFAIIGVVVGFAKKILHI